MKGSFNRATYATTDGIKGLEPKEGTILEEKEHQKTEISEDLRKHAANLVNQFGGAIRIHKV